VGQGAPLLRYMAEVLLRCIEQYSACMLLHDLTATVLALAPDPSLAELAEAAKAQEERTRDVVTTLTFALAALTPVVYIAVLEFIDRDLARWTTGPTKRGWAGWLLAAYIVTVLCIGGVTAFCFWILMLAVKYEAPFPQIMVGAGVALAVLTAVTFVRVGAAMKRVWRETEPVVGEEGASAPVVVSPQSVEVTNLPAQQVVTTSTTVATASLITGTFLAVGGLIIAAGRFTPPRR